MAAIAGAAGEIAESLFAALRAARRASRRARSVAGSSGCSATPRDDWRGDPARGGGAWRQRARGGCSRRRRSATAARARAPGLTVVAAGGSEAGCCWRPCRSGARQRWTRFGARGRRPRAVLAVLRQWGTRTLGAFAALPPRSWRRGSGRPALRWQAIARARHTAARADARGRAVRCVDRARVADRGLEPLSFVLTRLLEPLSTRLERRDRGAAAIASDAAADHQRRQSAAVSNCRRRCATCGRCAR